VIEKGYKREIQQLIRNAARDSSLARDPRKRHTKKLMILTLGVAIGFLAAYTTHTLCELTNITVCKVPTHQSHDNVALTPNSKAPEMPH